MLRAGSTWGARGDGPMRDGRAPRAPAHRSPRRTPAPPAPRNLAGPIVPPRVPDDAHHDARTDSATMHSPRAACPRAQPPSTSRHRLRVDHRREGGAALDADIGSYLADELAHATEPFGLHRDHQYLARHCGRAEL